MFLRGINAPLRSQTASDLTGDGLLDYVVAANTGDTSDFSISFFENTGTASAPAFTEVDAASTLFV